MTPLQVQQTDNAMRSPNPIAILALLIGGAWLVSFTGLAAFSGIAQNQYEYLLGGRPLPMLTSVIIAGHQQFGIASAITVFATFAFGSFFLMWIWRNPGDLARGALIVFALTFVAILFYIFASVTALLLPFVTIIARMELSPTETTTSIHWPTLWTIVALVYGVCLIVIARRLNW